MSNRDDQRKYYNSTRETSPYWVEGIPMPHFYPNRYALENLLKNLRGKEVLDFGCGIGQFSYYLTKRGAKVTAIDVSERNIGDLDQLKKAFKVPIEALVASVDDCPFRDESFDIIFGSAVLHHLELGEEKKASREVYRLLRKDGVAIFIEPLVNSRCFKKLSEYVPIRDKYNPRPSRVSKTFREYSMKSQHPDRPLTSRHFLEMFGQAGFDVGIKEIGIFNRIDRLTRNGAARFLVCALDFYCLQYLVPFRSKFCRNIVIIARKGNSKCLMK